MSHPIRVNLLDWLSNTSCVNHGQLGACIWRCGYSCSDCKVSFARFRARTRWLINRRRNRRFWRWIFRFRKKRRAACWTSCKQRITRLRWPLRIHQSQKAALWRLVELWSYCRELCLLRVVAAPESRLIFYLSQTAAWIRILWLLECLVPLWAIIFRWINKDPLALNSRIFLPTSPIASLLHLLCRKTGLGEWIFFRLPFLVSLALPAKMIRITIRLSC